VTTLVQVLSEDERAQVHERSLGMLSKAGVWVDTAQGRQILKEAGADVNKILASHEPLPFSKEVEQELDRIQKRAKA